MKIATWNINGVKARIETAPAWLKEAEPDIVCLQEIKSIDENFPKEVFEDLGYNVATHGQKSFNGVAVLSKLPFDDVRPRLPGNDDDVQARYLEVSVSTDFGALTVASLYLPNGNPLGGEKFAYKLAWMQRLEEHIKVLKTEEVPFILAGDYNVIPEPRDAKRPDVWTNDALFQPESRAAYQRYLSYGLTDGIRACLPEDGTFTFWDYQAGAWQKDNGIRIDHLLMSPEAADLLQGAGIDRETRGWEKPSDHVPAWVRLGTDQQT